MCFFLYFCSSSHFYIFFFFFNDTATTEIYTLSLHDALPILIAQRLYEGVELGEEGLVGLITYMRTDSTRVSNEALAEVRELIPSQYGKEFLPEQPNSYKSKQKGAQEAHEAIRPSSAARHPDQSKQYLTEDE